MVRQQCTPSRLPCSSHQQKRVACEIEWEVDIKWEVFNKSQSNSIGTFLLWFICTLPFETSGTASCGTTGIYLLHTDSSALVCHKYSKVVDSNFKAASILAQKNKSAAPKTKRFQHTSIQFNPSRIHSLQRSLPGSKVAGDFWGTSWQITRQQCQFIGRHYQHIQRLAIESGKDLGSKTRHSFSPSRRSTFKKKSNIVGQTNIFFDDEDPNHAL